MIDVEMTYIHLIHSIKVFDANSMEQLCVIEKANVIDFWLSPQGSYLATWERPCEWDEMKRKMPILTIRHNS